MRPAKTTQGSNSRIGIEAGRGAAGANVDAVMSTSWGYRVPVQERLRRGKGLTLGRKQPITVARPFRICTGFHPRRACSPYDPWRPCQLRVWLRQLTASEKDGSVTRDRFRQM